MAEKLLMYYKYMAEQKGLAGKVALAQATKIPSTQAATESDSPENIDRFRKAIQDLTGKPVPEF